MVRGDVAAAWLLFAAGFCVTVGATTEATAKHLCVVVAEKPYSAFPETLQLVRLVEADKRFKVAREMARRRLAEGQRLGGGELPDREELHERDSLR